MSHEHIDEQLEERGLFRCWCGDLVHFEDLGELEELCGGTGSLQCYCGGDQCVCHNHGEQPCDGCEDCEYDDGDYDDFDRDDYSGGWDDGFAMRGQIDDDFGEGIFDDGSNG